MLGFSENLISAFLILGIVLSSFGLLVAFTWALIEGCREDEIRFRFFLKLATIPLSIIAISGFGMALHFQRLDNPPKVSPNETLIRTEEPDLYESSYQNVRAAELIANWHYRTKKVCGATGLRCAESRISYSFADTYPWIDQNSYIRIERVCTSERSDKYATCLMGNWWGTYEDYDKSETVVSDFKSLAQSDFLRTEACIRDPDSVYYCDSEKEDEIEPIRDNNVIGVF